MGSRKLKGEEVANLKEYFGNYPFEPGDKKPTVLDKRMMKTFIYTEHNPNASDINWLLASTDKLTVGIFQLAPGGSFDPPDVHDGDEVYYILHGSLIELNPAQGQTLLVNRGESLLIPQGVPHKAFNFTKDIVRILYVIAPKIWNEDGPPATYDGPVRIYKYSS